MGKFSELAERIGKEYQEGELIFRQGDPADSMYMIYSGSVSVSLGSGESRIELGRLGPGDLFGEMAIVDNRPRAATVKALEDSVLIPVTAAFLRDNIRKDHRFIFQIIETLILRIDSTGRTANQVISEGTAISDATFAGDTARGAPDMLHFLKIFKGYADPQKYCHFEGSEVIFEEGDPGDLMFVVLEGTVDISVDRGGTRRVLARMGRGDFFGESALITGLPRSAKAHAVSDAVVLPVVRKDLVDGLMSDPAAALQLVRALVLRLRRNLELLSQAKLKGPGLKH